MTKSQEPNAARVVQPDKALMGLIADFNEAYAKARDAYDKWIERKGAVTALADCPPWKTPAEDQDAYERYGAFYKEHGATDLYGRWTELSSGVKRTALAVFAAEAHTIRGAVEKLKIVHLARGDEDGTGDDELETCQYDSQERWFASVMRDFERLVGEGGEPTPDPVIELVERYRHAREKYCSEALPDKETDAFDENVLSPIEDELLATKPTTQKGIAVVLDFALEVMERDADHIAKPLIQNARNAAREGVSMSGQAGDDPLVALWTEWTGFEFAKYHEGMSDETEEGFNARITERADKIGVEILSAPPKTLIGAFVQIALIANWALNTPPHAGEPSLKRLYARVGRMIDPKLPLGLLAK